MPQTHEKKIEGLRLGHKAHLERQRARMAAMAAAPARVCVDCENELPNTSDYFYPRKNGRLLTRHCRECQRERNRISRQSPRAKATHERNRAARNERNRLWEEKNKVRIKLRAGRRYETFRSDFGRLRQRIHELAAKHHPQTFCCETCPEKGVKTKLYFPFTFLV